MHMSDKRPEEIDTWFGAGPPAPNKQRKTEWPGTPPSQTEEELDSAEGEEGDSSGKSPAKSPQRPRRQSFQERRDFERLRPGVPDTYDNFNRHNPEWHTELGQPVPSQDAATWRLFIAIEIPPAAIEEIADFINDMAPGASSNMRWTARENVHLTLQFLGDTDPTKVGQIQRNIAEAVTNTGPFTLSLDETGVFPDFRAPRILWVSLAGEVRRLMMLQGRIEGSMKAMGFQPERRPFTPHVTVGRVSRDLTDQQLGDIGFGWRRSVLPPKRAQIPVREVVLYRSRLQSGGPVYDKLFVAKLGG